MTLTADRSTSSIRISGNRKLRRARSQANAASAGGAFYDVVGQIADRGNLTPRQIGAGQWFYALLSTYHGSSAGLITGYRERVDTSAPATRSHGGSSTSEFVVMQWVLQRLHPHERRMMEWLVTYSERPAGRRSLHYYVLDVVNLDAQRQYAVPMAVGHLQALLETIAGLREQYAQTGRHAA